MRKQFVSQIACSAPIARDVTCSVVCVSVCWAHGWAVQKQLNWSWEFVGGWLKWILLH